MDHRSNDDPGEGGRLSAPDQARGAMIWKQNNKAQALISRISRRPQAEIFTPGQAQRFEALRRGEENALRDNGTTKSDEWAELAESGIPDSRTRLDLVKISQAILNRNAYEDGVPFCPLCGKLGIPEHNGAPVINAQVCEACNNRKVIPARIREATAQAKKERENE